MIGALASVFEVYRGRGLFLELLLLSFLALALALALPFFGLGLGLGLLGFGNALALALALLVLVLALRSHPSRDALPSSLSSWSPSLAACPCPCLALRPPPWPPAARHCGNNCFSNVPFSIAGPRRSVHVPRVVTQAVDERPELRALRVVSLRAFHCPVVECLRFQTKAAIREP